MKEITKEKQCKKLRLLYLKAQNHKQNIKVNIY